MSFSLVFHAQSLTSKRPFLHLARTCMTPSIQRPRWVCGTVEGTAAAGTFCWGHSSGLFRASPMPSSWEYCHSSPREARSSSMLTGSPLVWASYIAGRKAILIPALNSKNSTQEPQGALSFSGGISGLLTPLQWKASICLQSVKAVESKHFGSHALSLQSTMSVFPWFLLD